MNSSDSEHGKEQVRDFLGSKSLISTHRMMYLCTFVVHVSAHSQNSQVGPHTQPPRPNASPPPIVHGCCTNLRDEHGGVKFKIGIHAPACHLLVKQPCGLSLRPITATSRTERLAWLHRIDHHSGRKAYSTTIASIAQEPRSQRGVAKL